MIKIVSIIIFLFFLCIPLYAGIISSPHDMTRGEGKADATMVCTFCHIPHGAVSAIALWHKERREEKFSILAWNKEEGQSSRILMCLSCHDGMIGTDIEIKSEGLEGYIKDHPVNKPFLTGRDGLEKSESIEEKGVLRDGKVECGSCHNPHSPENKPFLTKPLNEACITCHSKITSGRHIMGSFGLGDDHPVEKKTNPLRPEERMSCASCHNPHISNLLPVRKNEVCNLCHYRIVTRP